MNIITRMIIPLLCGLTFFLFGMNVMSESLEKITDGGLERAMKKLTSNDLSGFVLGASITIAIQSSSALTVIIVGLVNSGIIGFSNTFGIILGSNVGTTLTAWLLSLSSLQGKWYIQLLNPNIFAPTLAFIGIAMQMFSKNDKRKHIGTAFIGFCIIICGMTFMSDSVASLRTLPSFDKLLSTLESPIAALLISTVFTAVIQSSAATIGIVQALAFSGGITLEMVIPLVLGANIGTCATALIGSIGTKPSAKRVVFLHFLFNFLGSFFCITVIYIMKALSIAVLNTSITIAGVAVIHTLFNTINTALLFPFKNPLIKFCEWVIPNKTSANTHSSTMYI